MSAPTPEARLAELEAQLRRLEVQVGTLECLVEQVQATLETHLDILIAHRRRMDQLERASKRATTPSQAV